MGLLSVDKLFYQDFPSMIWTMSTPMNIPNWMEKSAQESAIHEEWSATRKEHRIIQSYLYKQNSLFIH